MPSLNCFYQPGRLSNVQGMGWWLEEENMAQISLNLLDHEITPMHIAFEEAVKDAKVQKSMAISSFDMQLNYYVFIYVYILCMFIQLYNEKLQFHL